MDELLGLIRIEPDCRAMIPHPENALVESQRLNKLVDRPLEKLTQLICPGCLPDECAERLTLERLSACLLFGKHTLGDIGNKSFDAA